MSSFVQLTVWNPNTLHLLSKKDKEKQQINRFKKLEPPNVWHDKMTETIVIDYQNG